jgi:hypothetical protein
MKFFVKEIVLFFWLLQIDKCDSNDVGETNPNGSSDLVQLKCGVMQRSGGRLLNELVVRCERSCRMCIVVT